MEIPLTPEQESLLVQLAAAKGKTADTIAAEVIRIYLDEQTPFTAAVRLGEEELEGGEYLTSQQVGAHIAHLFNA